MPQPDEFSTYVQDLLTGSYDCVDRISLRGYFPLGQASGGMITWWNQLRPGVPISQKALRAMAGDFGRRVHAFAEKNQLPLEHFELGDKSKHVRAEQLRPSDPNFKGLFAIFVARASGLVWQIKNNRHGKPVLRRPKKWPLINHYHFHIIDPDWGHLNIKVSGHPPFGLQISLNGHNGLVGGPSERTSLGSAKATALWAAIYPVYAEWPRNWTERRDWPTCSASVNAGSTARVCALACGWRNNNARAFTIVTPVRNWSTAATCTSAAAASSMKSTKD